MRFSDTYPLKPFQQQNLSKIIKVIERYPLATLISQAEGFPIVSQIPLIITQSDHHRLKLLGHFDRNNPHCQEILKQGNIYCIFNGPNHYISPAIYESPQFPGWNYVAVHVKGKVKPIEDKLALTDILLNTARQNEPDNSGYQLSASQKNFDTFAQMILGFEIEVIDIKGVFKLAQDKGKQNAEIARDHLNDCSTKDISAFLEDLLK